MSRYIDADAISAELRDMAKDEYYYRAGAAYSTIFERMAEALDKTQTAEVMTYTEIAEMLNDLFGDPCPCDYNGIDEWLPFGCKYEKCPQPGDARCWEEYLRHRR